MRKLFYLLIAMLVLMSCGNGSKKKRKTKRKKYSLTALKFSIFMERNDVSLAGRLKPIQ